MLSGVPDEHLIVRELILREFSGLIKLGENLDQFLMRHQGPNVAVLVFNVREQRLIGFDFF